ncbi:HEXXH motif-containing putative peptide modification protein [Streptomyces sp. E5N298]|uniref:aKG-HExxH-type peptide beta-hydroxylase n=1 Tax=Streptomyces sp. E5N298 TaxID=1851983 RepID=UPI000EF5733F|nr:HEXXH motif-containing putative peptide modification protein [Streptomyces sp. E5N298]
MTRASVPPDVLTALAGTRPTHAGTQTLRAAVHARRMLLLKALLVRVERQHAHLPHPVRRGFEDDWALLERAERTDPGAVREVLDYPTTGAWLTEALAAPAGPEFEAHLAHLTGVAVVAAARAGCPATGTLRVPSGLLGLPGLGVLRCPSGRARVGDRDGRLRVVEDAGRGAVDLPRRRAPAQDGARGRTGHGYGWSALRALPGGTAVLDDLDPYRVPHPGIGPTAVPAADRAHTDHPAWAGRWRRARVLLSVTDPGRIAETDALVHALVPLAAAGRDGAVPTGATVRAAPGAVLTQLPAGAAELAETLVHETHHTKLAALDDSVPLCRPGGTLHRVAWRPDPRPAAAVLQGTYAHLALLDLWWRAQRAYAAPATWRQRAAERYGRYREQVGEALSVLRGSDELTCTGRHFVQEMHRHHSSLGTAVRNST